MAGLSQSGGGGGSGAVRAGRAYVELLANDSKLLRALDRAKARVQQFANFFVKVGGITGGVGAGILAAFKPAMDAIGNNAKIADLADLFSISGEKESRLFGIMAAGGSDLRDAQEGLVTFNQRINDALTGSGDEAKALFRELGVGAEQFANLDTADRFYKLIDAVKQSNSPLGKLGLLMKAVGEDTGKNLGGVLNLTAEQMRDLGAAFETSTADLNAAREAARSQALVVAQLGRIWGEIGTAILPFLKQFAEILGKNMPHVLEFVRGNREIIATIAAVATGMVAGGAALIAFGAAASGAAAAIGLVTGALKLVGVAVGLLFTPLGLVTALVGGLTYAFLTQTEAGKAFAGWVQSGLVGALNTAKEAWGGIVAAIQKGDLELAGAIAVKGLEVVWRDFVDTMTALWVAFKSPFVDTWVQIVAGVKIVWAEFLGWLDKKVNATVDTLLSGVESAFRIAGASELEKKVSEIRGGITSDTEIDRVTKENTDEIARKLKEELDRRKAGRISEVAAAMSDTTKARAELFALTMRARAPSFSAADFGGGGDFGPGAARAAVISGSRGSFSAAAAAQRFGSESIQKQQLGELQGINGGVQEAVQAMQEIGRGLFLR